MFCKVHISNAITAIRKTTKKYKKIMLTPRGERLNQNIVKELSKTEGLIIVCGRYEGVDQRFIDYNKLERNFCWRFCFKWW